MNDLLERIACAQQEEMSDLLDAVLCRYMELFPDWEISTISIDRNADRNHQIDKIIGLLETMKQSE